jgi:hypothetical protein
VEYLVSPGIDATALEWSTSACSEGVQVVGGVTFDYRSAPLASQRVTMTATLPDGSSETVQVIKGEL